MVNFMSELPYFSSKAFLAPMAGVSDPALRLMCKKMGAGLVVTELTSVNAIVAKQKSGGTLTDLEQDIITYQNAIENIDNEIRHREHQFAELAEGKSGEDLAALEKEWYTGPGGILELRGHLAEKSEMLGDAMQGWKDINAEQKKINLELENTLLQKSLENATILNDHLNNQRAASGTQGVPIVVGGSTAVSKTDNFVADKSASNEDEVIKSHILKLRFGT